LSVPDVILAASNYQCRGVKEPAMSQGAQGLALVTGGTSGIGRATAVALAAAGYRVVATGLFEEELQECRRDPGFAGIELTQLDVGDVRAVERVIAGRERLDVLVNAAGVPRGPDEFTDQGFCRTLEINLNGSMRCCYAAQRLLAARGGAIVNIASMMSFFGSATGPAYAASKGAIVQLTKSLAVAWAPQSIRCNAVAPGWIDTPMTRSMQTDQARYGSVLARTPMGRWGKAEEVAKAILFLASTQASFITGAVLPVDGGYLVNGI
jgi:NAD(P)-dependent dehydrogenase (short-subunit alcohol dehydrogenase family)